MTPVDSVGDELAEHSNTEVSELIQSISSDRFSEWYREEQVRENVRNGQSYFNKPPKIPPPNRHNPSQFLQCHRKIYYRQLNSPKETDDPSGIFWFGSAFETDIVVPFLESVAREGEYIQNSIWVDFEVKSPIAPLHIRGETDPVFVDAVGNPILLTEIKSKQSVDHTDSPNEHHLAQTHAYLYGLSQKFDRHVTDALLLYGSRQTLDIKVFHVEFDPWFWRETVLKWAAAHTEFRQKETLPPADPYFDWECKFCPYRHRCGRGIEGVVGDQPPAGFAPDVEYSRSNVLEHLEAYSDLPLKITPTLAERYPELTNSQDVSNYTCLECQGEIPWQSFNGTRSCCPHCGGKSSDQVQLQVQSQSNLWENKTL